MRFRSTQKGALFLFTMTLFELRAEAIFNPADTAALSAIAANTASTLSVLRTATSLLEVSSELSDSAADAREDADAIQDLMTEISPEPDSVEYQRRYADAALDRQNLDDVNQVLLNADSVKWESGYLYERSNSMSPQKVAPVARLTTRAVRLGKKISKLMNGSAQEKTAYHSDVIATNSLVSAKMIADIRNLLTDMRDQQARERLKSILNTAEFLYAVAPDFDAEIRNRRERSL